MLAARTTKATITLGADVGGKDAHTSTAGDVLALRRCLEAECRGSYGTAFDEFALVLRIDGAVQTWNKCGVDNVRLQRKLRYATADIFVPRASWSAETAGSFRRCIADGVTAAMSEIVTRATRAGDDIKADDLCRDVATATRQFLARK
jgi:hypothetical protein